MRLELCDCRSQRHNVAFQTPPSLKGEAEGDRLREHAHVTSIAIDVSFSVLPIFVETLNIHPCGKDDF